ncbi:MAG: hypothetical protein ACKO13_16030 [Cytophagales bacterium]
MSKKENKPSKPRVHKELNGFEVSVNQFGELQSNMSIEKINTFLNKNVDDKKLLEKEEKERLRNEKKKK